MNITWTASTPTPQYYTLNIISNLGVVNITSPTNSFTKAGIPFSTAVTVKVSAVLGSQTSNTVTATANAPPLPTVPPPTNIQITFTPVYAENKAKAKITWTAPNPAPASYAITAVFNGGSTNYSQEKTSLDFVPLIPYGTPLTVTVASVNAYGKGTPATATATPPRYLVVKKTVPSNFLGNDKGSGASGDAGWWRTNKVSLTDSANNSSYTAYPVGDHLMGNGGNLSWWGYSTSPASTVLVGGDVQPATSYTNLWGPLGDRGFSTKRMTCPSGYVPMGDLHTNNNFGDSSLADMRCVPQDCVKNATQVGLAWPHNNPWGLYKVNGGPSASYNLFTKASGQARDFTTDNTKCNISYI